MRFFDFTKMAKKIGKMTQDDLLTLTMVSSESLENTEEQKKISTVIMLCIAYTEKLDIGLA